MSRNEPAGLEVLQLAQELAESLAAHAKHLGVSLGGLKTGGILDEVVHAPELYALVQGVEGLVRAHGHAVLQDDIILPGSGVAEVEPPALLHGGLLASDMLGEQLDVAHHPHRVAEDVGVDPLDQQLVDLLPVIDRDIIGRVDVSRRDPAVHQNVPFDAELGTDIGEFFLDFVHD